MTAFIAFLVRTGSAFANPFFAPRDYQRPAYGAQSQDFARVMGDMRRVGNDTRLVVQRELARYGQ
jgi:hypothetical protein